VSLFRLYGLSFREYLEFNLEIELPKITLPDLLEQHAEFANALNVPQPLKHFKQYLQVGYFPFSKQFSQNLQIFQAIDNIAQKTIFEDIASLHSLKTPSLLVIEKLYKYVVHSQPGEFSAYKLANALSKDFDSVTTYLRYLEQAGLVRNLYKKQAGKAYLRNPAKLYPENPNLIYATYLSQPDDMVQGKVRESFAMNQLQNGGATVHYSTQGDFAVDEYVFEVGGKNKTRKQIKEQANSYVLADGIVLGRKTKVPLYLLGFLM
jgi:predicted AAA+ superfamily ATPase